MTPEEREKQIQEKLSKKTEEKSKAKEGQGKKDAAKKLKGKDWFLIMSPPEFGSNFIGETPTLDPKTLIGRTIEANLAEISNKPNKYHMNLIFRIKALKDHTAETEFHGFFCSKEYMFRMVRKKVQKVRTINDVVTKDDWALQLTSVIVLNRNTKTEIQKKVRKFIAEYLEKNIREAPIDKVIKGVLAGAIQKNIRMAGSKIYPIRFSEIEKIEVLKRPA